MSFNAIQRAMRAIAIRCHKKNRAKKSLGYLFCKETAANFQLFTYFYYLCAIITEFIFEFNLSYEVQRV